MRTKRGFTLIEILVVIVIIGISASFIMIAIGDFGAKRQVTTGAEQLSSYIKLLQQRAILSGDTLGIKLSSEGYEPYLLSNNKWQALSKKGLFHYYAFPKKTKLSFKKNLSKMPDIIIYNSGDLNNFEVHFGTEDEPHILTLIGQNNGQIMLIHRKNDK